MHFKGLVFGEDYVKELAPYWMDRKCDTKVAESKLGALKLYNEFATTNIMCSSDERFRLVQEKYRRCKTDRDKVLFVADWYYEGAVDENLNVLSVYNKDGKWDYYDLYDGLVNKQGYKANQMDSRDVDWDKTLDKYGFYFILTNDGWIEHPSIGRIITSVGTVTSIDCHG